MGQERRLSGSVIWWRAAESGNCPCKAAKPGVILADEPTGNLDYQTGQEIMKLICASRELYRQTIVMVTHDMDSANYADRIVYMEDGALR